MIPSLHRHDATEFATLGYGAIRTANECTVTEKSDGTFELNMVMLAEDELMEYIKVGNIITAKPNLTQNSQAFCIETINKDIDGKIEIYAPHIAQYRAKMIPVLPFTSSSLSDSLEKLISYSQETNPFVLHTDKTSNAGMSVTVPHSFRELLRGTEGSLADTYRGEFYFDNFDIYFLNRRGRDNGIKILYGKNMTEFDLEQNFSWSGSVTGVLPYWTSDNNGTVIGDIQYSQYKDLYKYNRTVVADLTEQFENKPTKAELNTYAQTLVNSRGLDDINLSVGFDYLESFENTKTLQIGDTVNIINSLYDVNISSRIVGTEFDVLAETYKKIEIGELKESINESIESITATSETRNYYSTGDILAFSSDDQVICAGLATSNRNFLFTLPLNKMVYSSTAEFTNLTLSIRTVDGQKLIGADIVAAGYSISVNVGNVCGLRVYCTAPSSIGLTANTPITVAVSTPSSVQF